MTTSKSILRHTLFLAAGLSILAVDFAKADVDAKAALAKPTEKGEKVESLLYTCNMSFRASGKSVYLGIGFTDVYGKGTLSCFDYLTGANQEIPIRVTARGPGAGLGVTGLAISGGATGIGISKRPESLLGHYVAIRAGASIGVGTSTSLGLHLSNGAATIDASIQAQGGLGAGIDLLYVDIEAIVEKSAPAVAESKGKTPVINAGPIATTLAPAPIVASQQPAVTGPIVSAVAVQVLYVAENQPVQIVDSQGKLLQVIYLKRKQ